MDIKTIGNWLYLHRYKVFFVAIGIVYLFNMFIDVMEVDAAQYASIAMEMLSNGSYLEVFHRGQDYLDKPPLLFWMSALSFAIFGVSTFAYKLPAIIVIIIGIYSTYRFTKLWYDDKRAVLSALIVATTQGLMLMTNDVRTDGILTGFVMFSIWQLSEFLIKGSFKFIVFGSIGVALAMMSKGPLGLIIPGFAFASHILLNRTWSKIFKWQWIVFIVLIAICLIPMSYGLYTQFDLHPEKSVYGLDGPSGLRFFYWTQSFGRITGENYWDNGAPFTFFMHSILWDFQPWVLFLVFALVFRFKELIVNKLKSPNAKEQISLGGFVLVFLSLSSSNFKLPHYIFPIFPLAAIFTSDYIVSLYDKKNKYFNWLLNIQFGLMHIFFIMIGISLILFFQAKSFVLPLFLLLLLMFYYVSYFKISSKLEKLIAITIVANIMLNIVMASNFYPQLLQYQPNSVLGKMVKQQNIPNNQFYFYKVHGHALDFYAQRILSAAEPQEMAEYPLGTYICTNEKGKDEILSLDFGYEVFDSLPDYRVTLLKPKFLYAKTRSETLNVKYLLKRTESISIKENTVSIAFEKKSIN